MEKQGVCTIYSAGKTTGTVIDSGAGVTHVVPVYEGFIMEHAISKMNLAGRDLTMEWCKMLQEAPDADGIDFTESSALQDIAMVFKEKNCRVAAMGTFADECKDFKDQQVLKMPDGKEITVGNQIIRCPEIMFNTSMIGKAEMGGGGIHHMVLKAIRDCSPDVHSTLTQNLVLSGGNTLFPGFEDRIAAEVTAAGDGVEAKVFAAPERAISVFIGGAILTSLETMEWQYAKDNLNTDPARQGYESIGAAGIEAAMM
jgi:actin